VCADIFASVAIFVATPTEVVLSSISLTFGESHDQSVEIISESEVITQDNPSFQIPKFNLFHFSCLFVDFWIRSL